MTMAQGPALRVNSFEALRYLIASQSSGPNPVTFWMIWRITSTVSSSSSAWSRPSAWTGISPSWSTKPCPQGGNFGKLIGSESDACLVSCWSVWLPIAHQLRMLIDWVIQYPHITSFHSLLSRYSTWRLVVISLVVPASSSKTQGEGLWLPLIVVQPLLHEKMHLLHSSEGPVYKQCHNNTWGAQPHWIVARGSGYLSHEFPKLLWSVWMVNLQPRR